MSIFEILCLLATALLFFLITNFWSWLSDFHPIQFSVLVALVYFVLCVWSFSFIAQWLGVDENKQLGFVMVCMVFLLYIHTKYYEHLQENK